MNTYGVWETINLDFEAKFKGNPFTDIEFYMKVHGEEMASKTVHGFYNGGMDYRIRLTFDQVGTYSYITCSNVPELNGIDGELIVTSNKDEDISMAKHGGLALKEEQPNRLFYDDGRPYNLLGFECDWLFALSYDDQIAMTKTRSLIKQISDNGFNHLIMNVYAFDLQWERDEWVRDAAIKAEHDYSRRLDIYPFMGSNEMPDHSRLNVDFFKHLDRVIECLDDKNIVAHLMIYVWNKKVNWPQAGSIEDNMYYDYVVKRYQGYNNIVWDISKEALGYGHCDMAYLVGRVHRLKSMDAYSRLVTVHDYAFCNQHPELVDFISYQTWHLGLHAHMLEASRAHPNKVMVNVEHGGYEESPYEIFTGNYTGSKICLRRNYEVIFSGAYSCYYWQALSWSIMMLPEEATINRPHLEYYGHMKKFMDEYSYHELRPNKAIGHGAFYMGDEEETRIIGFIPKENHGASFGGKVEGKSARYLFFNTITGEYSGERAITFKHHNKFVSPFDEDSILIVLDIK